MIRPLERLSFFRVPAVFRSGGALWYNRSIVYKEENS